VSSWEVITTIVAPDNSIESLDFSEDGATLYVGTFEGDLAFYDARTGDRSAPSIDTRGPGATGAVTTAPAEHVITISSPGVIQRWSVDRSGPFGTWLESGEGVGIFSPDSSRFVRTNDPRTGWITVYDPASGDVIEAVELDEANPLGGIDFSSDGERMAVSKPPAGGDFTHGGPGDVVLYDAETLEPTGQVLPDQGFAFLEFSPDGERLAVGANYTADYSGYLSPPTAPFAAHVWHIDSGVVTPLELTVDFEGAGRPTWSPDGTKVAISDLFGGEAVFDAATGTQVGSRFSVRGQDQAHDVLWEPNGQSVLGVGAPGISRWDVTTGERTSPFTEATAGDWMDLADDGRLLVTASRQGEARLWDLVAEVPLGVPFPDPGTGRILEDSFSLAPFPALSTDGRYLAMSGARGSVIWSLDAQLWRERACQLAGRNMTENEWANVMGEGRHRPTCDQWPAG
jgi:WD40 repeat protein